MSSQLSPSLPRRAFLARPQAGFSLIELMVTVSVFALMVGLAAPSFSTWMANAKVRTVAESLENGLRLAQAEAVRRNRQVVFVLTSQSPSLTARTAANGNHWMVQVLPLLAGDERQMVQAADLGSASSGVVVASDSASVCFGFSGRLVANDDPGIAGATCSVNNVSTNFDISRPGSDGRTLRVMVGVAGQVRMCDLSRDPAAGEPDGCPRTTATAAAGS